MSLTADILDRFVEICNYNNKEDDGDVRDLDCLKIAEIKPDAFKNCRHRKIRSLRLRYYNSWANKTTYFTEKHSSLFKPLKEHLEELSLECSLKCCEFNFLEHLSNLRKLSLCGSNFRKGKPVFNGANNQLVHLDLSNCELKISDKTVFNDLKSLKHLDLSKVELDANVMPELFSELKQLDTLTMNGTKLTLVKDAFIHLENLKELHLEEIEISNECSNIFAPLKSLQKLVIGETPTFNYDALKQVKNLRQLKLSRFKTIEVGEKFFDNNHDLESLDVFELYLFGKNLDTNENCKCETYCIDLKALANLTALKSLNLRDNNLKFDDQEDSETIFSMENLESLDLSLCDRKNFIKRELKLNETTVNYAVNG